MTMDTQRQTLISVRNLSKDFENPEGGKFTVLENISLTVREGEFVAILGLSGSGKSTLLRCMADLIIPDRGQVEKAKVASGYARFSSFVFQSFAILPWCTVRENIELVLRHLPRKQRLERINGILTVAGLRGFEDAYPRQLSGGMRQRVGICRAIVSDPMVLFMDEPFGALDPLTANALRIEIERLWSAKERTFKSVVMVTHSITEAVSLADRIIILSAKPGRVFHDVEVPFTRPRDTASQAFQTFEKSIEHLFGSLSLEQHDMELAVQEDKKTQSPVSKPRHFPPIFDVTISQIQGLLLHLRSFPEGIDLYDVCDNMGQEAHEVTPIVMMAEILGMVDTSGIHVMLTSEGKEYTDADTHEAGMRIFRRNLLRNPLFSEVYNIIQNNGGSVEKSVIISQLAMILPFENSEKQFYLLLAFGTCVGLFAYDDDSHMVYLA